MKLIVLGSNGMMGSMLVYVCRQENIEYQAISRKEFDVLRDDLSVLEGLIGDTSDVVVVNCIGCIPQKQYSEADYKAINEEFPHKLAKVCVLHAWKLVHLSTDCVYSGKISTRLETDIPDSETVYGQSKYRGEPFYGTVFRCSIIGPEKYTSSGLLAWFLHNSSPSVQGYTHHYWNGLTTLELSRYICHHARDGTLPTGLQHLYSKNTLSKYAILCEAKARSKKQIEIVPFETPVKYYVLGSVGNQPQQTIEEQLDDLFACMDDFLAST